MLQKNNKLSRSTAGSTNPIVIILVLLLAIFIAVIALFIKQMIARQQPRVASLTPEPGLELPSVIEPITPVTPPTVTPSTPVTFATPAAGTRDLNASASTTPTEIIDNPAIPKSTVAIAPLTNNTTKATTTPVPTATPKTTTPSTTTNTTSSSNRKSSLKGKLYLSGDIPQDATILVLQKLVNDSTYKVITRVPAQREISWEWAEALAGQKYNINYALQVNNENVHTAPVATAVAPATITTRMNTTSDPNARTITSKNTSNLSRPWLSSCGNYKDNKFGATVKIPKKDGAKNYKIMAGTSEAGTEIADRVLAPNGNDDINFYFDAENDKSYFVRYAVDMGDGKYSDHSATVEIKCRLK